jgi:hypothetical protein
VQVAAVIDAEGAGAIDDSDAKAARAQKGREKRAAKLKKKKR